MATPTNLNLEDGSSFYDRLLDGSRLHREVTLSPPEIDLLIDLVGEHLHLAWNNFSDQVHRLEQFEREQGMWQQEHSESET